MIGFALSVRTHHKEDTMSRTTRSELTRREQVIDEYHATYGEDALETSRLLNELRWLETNIVEPLLEQAAHAPAPGNADRVAKFSAAQAFERGLLTLTEVLDAVEAHEDAIRREEAEADVARRTPTDADTLCDTHEAGACPEGCPDAYGYNDAEVILELDACGDLETLLGPAPMKVWVRMTHAGGPGSPTYWPVVEVRGARRDVCEYVALHWGEDFTQDLVDDGEL
jgi:hypothetical protein